jgi:Fe-S-cluster containining protein
LLKTEAERIANKTKMRLESFAEEVTGFEPYVYTMRKNAGKCVFLKENLCTIYAARPLICRFYPFELKKMGNGVYAFDYTEECPGIKKGPLLKRSFFESLFKTFRKLMTKNLQEM